MEVIAKLNYLRLAPRKVRLAADLLRGKSALEAERQLQFLTKRASGPLLKLLRSAVANAEHNFRLKKENLRVAKITVDEGPPLKRTRPRAFGRAFPIKKRTSHVTIVLAEIHEGARKAARPKKQEKPLIRRLTALGEVAEASKVEKKAAPDRAPEKIAPKEKPVNVFRRVFQRKAI